jgi:regulator of RNase E activity RraA
MSDLLTKIRLHLYTAVVCDALDQIGRTGQSPRVPLPRLAGGPMGALPSDGSNPMLAGRCKTTLWADMYHRDPSPYALELQAVDACQKDDVLIAAAGGSMRSGIWGELLTTAAIQRGCVGVLVDGAIRDVDKIASMPFSVHAKGTCIYDSLNRQRVIDVDVRVEIDGVPFEPGDLVLADSDGVVVVPRQVEDQVLELAFAKVLGENRVRDAIRAGMSATQAFATFGIL